MRNTARSDRRLYFGRRSGRHGAYRALVAAFALLCALLASLLAPAPALAAAGVSYRTHVQNVGWQSNVSDGALSGTEGRALRLESIVVNLSGVSGGIQYRTHVQNDGWLGWVDSGKESGTTGRGLRLEAIQIRLTGQAEKLYDVEYRVHVQNEGWQGWVRNGASSGTSGKGLRLEAIQIRLVAKPTAVKSGNIVYRTHVQNEGWQDWKADGETSGTSGKAYRLEGINIRLGDSVSGSVLYQTHIQNIGWESSWKQDGDLSGTSGQALRLEAIRIKLAGDAANKYDIYYRVHAQDLGWMGWAKNGEDAGTSSGSKRLEAIEIRLVNKGGSAPGDTRLHFRNMSYHAIMGKPTKTATQMANHYIRVKGADNYPSAELAKGGAPTIQDFCQILYEEAVAEGVRPEIVYGQVILETGWIANGGVNVKEDFNFCGLGVTGPGVRGAHSDTVREGLRKQVQHLKAYASTDPLVNECIDPRFHLVSRGVAPYLEELGNRWAANDPTYGMRIWDIIAEI